MPVPYILIVTKLYPRHRFETFFQSTTCKVVKCAWIEYRMTGYMDGAWNSLQLHFSPFNIHPVERLLSVLSQEIVPKSMKTDFLFTYTQGESSPKFKIYHDGDRILWRLRSCTPSNTCSRQPCFDPGNTASVTIQARYPHQRSSSKNNKPMLQSCWVIVRVV